MMNANAALAALTAACLAYTADPTDANWTAMLVADDAARLAMGVEVTL